MPNRHLGFSAPLLRVNLVFNRTWTILNGNSSAAKNSDSLAGF